MLGQFRPFVWSELLPSIPGLELFNEASLRADDEVVETHCGHFVEQPISDRLAETAESFIGLLFLGRFRQPSSTRVLNSLAAREIPRAPSVRTGF
jgi:hypothetical protein